MGVTSTKRGSYIVKVTVNGSQEVDAIWDPGADSTIINPGRIPGYIASKVNPYSGSLAYADGRKLESEGTTNAAIRVKDGKDVLMTPSIVAMDVEEAVILGNDWNDEFVEEVIKANDTLILKGSKDIVKMLRSNDKRCCAIKCFKKCTWVLEKEVLVGLDGAVRAVLVPSINEYGTDLRPDLPKSYRKQVEVVGFEVEKSGEVVALLKARVWNKLVLDEGTRIATSIEEGTMGGHDSEGKHAVENAAETRVGEEKARHHSAQPE